MGMDDRRRKILRCSFGAEGYLDSALELTTESDLVIRSAKNISNYLMLFPIRLFGAERFGWILHPAGQARTHMILPVALERDGVP